MSQNKRRHLTREETIKLHSLMKEYVELGNKINGVQYASYKAPGMHDIRMAEIAQERLGFPVTYIQARNMRTSLFGRVYRQKPAEKKPEPGPAGLSEIQAGSRALIASLTNRVESCEYMLANMKVKFNALLYHVQQLDTEWSSCRPPGYKPGLPEIVNDTKEMP